MKDKILIHTDLSGLATFENAIKDTLSQANRLIELFNGYQPFLRIHARDQAENLIMGPQGFYDSVILQNIKLPKMRNAEINPDSLAMLYNIPRSEFLSEIGIDPGQVKVCKDCNTPAPRKRNKDILTWDQYKRHSEFLIFENGSFDLNMALIEAGKDVFNIYIQNDKQKMYYDHFQTLCQVLNDHVKNSYGKMGPSDMGVIARATGLLINNQTFFINEFQMAQTIKYLK